MNVSSRCRVLLLFPTVVMIVMVVVVVVVAVVERKRKRKREREKKTLTNFFNPENLRKMSEGEGVRWGWRNE